jgi:hypothetical protein
MQVLSDEWRDILRLARQHGIEHRVGGGTGTRPNIVIAVLLAAVPAAAQELGNKVLGTLGLLAGAQPGRGIYVANRFLLYSANELVDRNGRPLPVGLDLDAVANAVGAQVTFQLPWHSIYLNASVGIPAAHISLNTERPEISVDRMGFADLYVQPLKIGWKAARFDLVGGYSFYAPTGGSAPGSRSGVGRGFWTNQFSVGSAVYLDRRKTWHISELVSGDLNRRRRDLDLTRGDTVQFQGGAGKTMGMWTVGLAGYGLWQVQDDRGSAVPVALRGARDRVFGLGPEVNLTFRSIRGRLIVRYCHDVAVKTRPLGQILVVGFTVLVHR